MELIMNKKPKQTYMYVGENGEPIESDDPHFRASLQPGVKPRMDEWDSAKRKFVSKRK